MIRLRPYQENDGQQILSWAKDEETFYKWSAGILGNYPITVEQFNQVTKNIPMCLEDENELVGFINLRKPNNCEELIRFGFVIVDSSKRHKGYGKAMLSLAAQYAKEVYGAKKVSLGVFENNPSAYYCYKAAGFKEILLDEVESYPILGQQWRCLEMEMEL